MLSTVAVALAMFSAHNTSSNSLMNKIGFMNAASGFPVTPIYAVYKQYFDVSCTNLEAVDSYLMNTCMSDASSSAIYSCGELSLLSFFPLLFVVWSQSLFFSFLLTQWMAWQRRRRTQTKPAPRLKLLILCPLLVSSRVEAIYKFPPVTPTVPLISEMAIILPDCKLKSKRLFLLS